MTFIDQYYYGSNATQQEATVQYILDSVIPELEIDPNKKFVYVEMAFFLAMVERAKRKQKTSG